VNGWYDGTREAVQRLFDNGFERGVWPIGGFEPPYSETHVASFEVTHDVHLPDEYRAFILGVGAAGAGPGSGLMSLERDRAWDDGDVSFFEHLRNEFHECQRVSSPPQATGDPSIDPHMAAYAATRSDGLLPIAKYADRALACLVVTGSLHGRVVVNERPLQAIYWFDDGAAQNLHGPLERHEYGLPMRFAEWYLDWLQAAVKGSVSR
jgi:hypothetical protein